MSALGMLNVAIGMIFIFLLLSLVCSAISEIIENFLKKRSTDLEKGIFELLRPKDDAAANSLLEKLYTHPLIYSLYEGNYKKSGKNLPSYIPASSFALALLDIIKPSSDIGPADASGTGISHFQESKQNAEGVTVTTLKPLRDAVFAWGDSNAKGAVLTLIDMAGNDLEKAKKNIEGWFDTSMDRVSGWYKRRVHRILVLLGFVLAAGMNADTIAVLKGLTNDSTLQLSMVNAAEKFITADAIGDTLQTAKERVEINIQRLNELRLPIGWDWLNENNKDTVNKSGGFGGNYDFHMPNYYLAVPNSFGGWLLKIIGWLITGLAVSLGASFWFDTLNKVMVIRSTVKPHEKSPEEDSEDRKKRTK